LERGVGLLEGVAAGVPLVVDEVVGADVWPGDDETVPLLEEVAEVDTVRAAVALRLAVTLVVDSGVALFDCVTLLDGMIDEDGVTLIEGVTLLDGVTDADGVTLLDGVTDADGVTLLEGVTLLDGVTDADGVTLLGASRCWTG
jgi:hypothetical protein